MDQNAELAQKNSELVDENTELSRENSALSDEVKEGLGSERGKFQVEWRRNCQLLMEYDNLLTEKDEEIARLKRRLDRLPMERSERSALHKDRGEPPPERSRSVVVRSPTVEPSRCHQPETESDRRTQGDTRERPADEHPVSSR